MEIIDVQSTECAHSAVGGVDEQQVRPRIVQEPGMAGKGGLWVLAGGGQGAAAVVAK